MRQYGKPFWASVPFLRLLLPLVTGILIGFYNSPSLSAIFSIGTCSLLFFILSRFLSIAKKYSTRWLTGICIHLLLVCIGILLIYTNDIRHQPNWVGNYKDSSETFLITVQEPLTEKEKSYKTTGNTEAVLVNGQWKKLTGKLFVYFRKDSMPNNIQYGSQLIIHKNLQYISNSGNPGGFDYRQYCAFQNMYHQVFLQREDFQLSAVSHRNIFTDGLFRARNNVLSVLKKYIPGEKEIGVAEALLIGYRNDLDKTLVQSYSNTGVVHIIAISGLHLGMIYGLLILLLKPIRKKKWSRWLKPLIILIVLWVFSLLTGAAASILRSAVMFSFIVIGESLSRRSNIYNTLAASAFCLLLYNPLFLWDVGFLLSYTAVLSIVLFMKPIYQWFYIENKLLRTIWQLNAVTLSAQVLTLPLILFYFHQFPNLFLFANFIAVPLSGFILYGELVLLICATIPVFNSITGKIVSFLIAQMNGYIERTSSLPFSVTDNILVSIPQTIALYLFISFMALWLLQKNTKAFCTALFFLLSFIILRSCYLFNTSRQQKLIIYNIPKYAALDVIEGTHFQFIGNRLLHAGYLQNFHLRPARIQFGASEAGGFNRTLVSNKLIATKHATILIINDWQFRDPPEQKIPVDIIILSGNPGVRLPELATVFNCTQYVFDSSNPLWKIRYWKKDADSLHLRHHSTSEEGAFVVDL
jgi:competence protein ComEC